MTYSQGLIGTYRRIYEDAPDEEIGGGGLWLHRTQNMVAAYLSGSAGARIERAANPDEYFVWALFHPVRVSAADETVEVPKGSVVIMPPGHSTVELMESGHVWLGFTALARDLIERCPNYDEYEPPVERISSIERWPEPSGGYRIRIYNLFERPAGTQQSFVSSTALVNFGYGFPGPAEAKPDTQLTPHNHDDFEQLSLVHSGTHVYHMRRIWGRDGTAWRPDEHVAISAPGIAVAKPPDIHTIQLVSNGIPGGVIDFFCPIRDDYARREGMINNRAEYPLRP